MRMRAKLRSLLLRRPGLAGTPSATAAESLSLEAAAATPMRSPFWLTMRRLRHALYATTAGVAFHAFVGGPHLVRGDDMWPKVASGALVFGLNYPWNVGTLRQGDVIIMKHPHHLDQTVCTRIVALPGDFVSDRNDNRPIPEGHMWVEGDNRTRAVDADADTDAKGDKVRDSLTFGPLPMGIIVCKVAVVYGRPFGWFELKSQ